MGNQQNVNELKVGVSKYIGGQKSVNVSCEWQYTETRSKYYHWTFHLLINF